MKLIASLLIVVVEANDRCKQLYDTLASVFLRLNAFVLFAALGQIMLYVDGMEGVIKHQETVRWLYSLIASKVSGLFLAK